MHLSREWLFLVALGVTSASVSCGLQVREGKEADRLVLEGEYEAAEKLYRMQLTRLESELLDAPTPELQNEHQGLLERLAKLNQHRLRRYEAAIGDWSRLIETHPDSKLAIEAGLAIAELYRYRLERPNDAIDAYKELRDGIAEPTSRARVDIELAELYFDLKRYDSVDDITEKLSESFGSSSLGYRAAFLRARAMTELGRHADAVSMWAALEGAEDPTIRAQVLFEKSFALEALGERVQAIDALHDALEHHPNPSLVQGMLKDLKTRHVLSEGGERVHGSKASPQIQRMRRAAAPKAPNVKSQREKPAQKPRKTAAQPAKASSTNTKDRPKTTIPKQATEPASKPEPAAKPTAAPSAAKVPASPAPDPSASDTN